jgi:hypothetical protein
MEKNKKDLNEKIAILLGFEKDDKSGAWIYPDDWLDELSGVPMYNIPDFKQMIEDCREIAGKYKYGIPKEYKK